MKIVWFTWKDRKNPHAGGAEIINEEIAKRLVRDGHRVTFIVAGFSGGKPEEEIDGFRIIRVGNRWSVYLKAYQYYIKHLKNYADLIIEEINTIPFMTQWYTEREKRVLFIYQLCREVWFYQLFFPLNLIGYLLEPIYLFLLRKNVVVTESKSTKSDLIKSGFNPKKTYIIPIGVEIRLLKKIQSIEKYPAFTMLSLGTIRAMKRTHHHIEAFEFAKKKIPELELIIAGEADKNYQKKILRMIANNQYNEDIKYLGRVTLKKKIKLLRQSHFITVTSVKEGWGLVVTEAASQGTPAIVYDVDGLRDSVKGGKTGIICRQNTPESLASNIIKLYRNKKLYGILKNNAWHWSKKLNFDKSYQEFKKIIITKYESNGS